MNEFVINPYYNQHNPSDINLSEIKAALDIAVNVINLLLADQESSSEFTRTASLIGVGNDAGGKVFSLLNTKFCLKVSLLGKHVGRDQTRQFELSNKCQEAVKNRTIGLEGHRYKLICVPPVAVSVDEKYAYTLLVRHDNTYRLWDEKIPFADKDHWDVTKALRKIFSKYDGKQFIRDMDVNGNNILVDIERHVLYLIDPYVPEI